MAKKTDSPMDDLGVVIPYKRLCELLRASEEVIELRQDNARLEDQVLSLRQIQAECMDKIRELERLI